MQPSEIAAESMVVVEQWCQSSNPEFISWSLLANLLILDKAIVLGSENHFHTLRE